MKEKGNKHLISLSVMYVSSSLLRRQTLSTTVRKCFDSFFILPTLIWRSKVRFKCRTEPLDL